MTAVCFEAKVCTGDAVNTPFSGIAPPPLLRLCVSQSVAHRAGEYGRCLVHRSLVFFTHCKVLAGSNWVAESASDPGRVGADYLRSDWKI